MTRINCGVPPHELCDQHLVAEYRELPRIVAFAHANQTLPDAPFTLGKGHMYSVARYGRYLADRHQRIVDEMFRRGFKPTLESLWVDAFPAHARELPSDAWLAEAAILVRVRIAERLAGMKRAIWTKPTVYGV